MKTTLLSATFALVCAGYSWSEEAKLTVRVVNEAGMPVSDARVLFAFEQLSGVQPALAKFKMTDNEGTASETGKTSGRVSMTVEKEGHYVSSPRPFISHTVEGGKFKPYNPLTEVVLKRKISPIPMYAQCVLLIIPVLNEPVGFDLKKGDWVAPYGKGEERDIVFSVSKRVVDFRDFEATLEIGFANLSDGIQEFAADPEWGSVLRSSHQAPSTGYKGSIRLQYSSEQLTDADNVGGANYLFRVRTKTDESGNITAANYGKIYGLIELFPVESKTAKIRFTYYFNPSDNDRNIEFDPNRNLFRPKRGEKRIVLP